MHIFENGDYKLISQMVEEKIGLLKEEQEFKQKYIKLANITDQIEKELPQEQKKLFAEMQELIYETEAYYFALSYSLGVKYGEDLQKI